MIKDIEGGFRVRVIVKDLALIKNAISNMKINIIEIESILDDVLKKEERNE